MPFPDNLPTLAEVRSLCQIAPVRVRAMILWETKTGCRPETSVNIRMKDVDRSQGYPWIVYPKHTKSSDTGNVTFADEECGEAMLVYWKNRRAGDDPDLPIFTQEHSPNRSIQPDSFWHGINQVMRRAKETGILRREVCVYGLRRVFHREFEQARKSMYSPREAYRSAMSRALIRVFQPIQTRTQFTEPQKDMMRIFLSGMKQNLPDEYYRMFQHETLPTSPDSLARAVFRELEQKK